MPIILKLLIDIPVGHYWLDAEKINNVWTWVGTSRVMKIVNAPTGANDVCGYIETDFETLVGKDAASCGSDLLQPICVIAA